MCCHTSMSCNIFILPITMEKNNYNCLKLWSFMAEKAPNQATAAQIFWDAFKACLEGNRVRPDRSPFYVKWSQASFDFIPGKNCGIVREKISSCFCQINCWKWPDSNMGLDPIFVNGVLKAVKMRQYRIIFAWPLGQFTMIFRPMPRQKLKSVQRNNT